MTTSADARPTPPTQPAQRALFAAAARVLQHHAAQLARHRLNHGLDPAQAAHA